MALLVAKFGGTSVGDIDRIKHAASKVAEEVKRGHKIAVVVSAMSGVTDRLITYCQNIMPQHDPREHDAVVAAGEQITAGLMAIALQQRGLRAKSWLGWQVPIRTVGPFQNAKIAGIETEVFRSDWESGVIPVVAGFQGIDQNGNIATLGRGGSDASAVALAAALKADRCDIYTDVDGVYTADPRIVHTARKIKNISYEEMLELASLGAKVLQGRSVEIAMRYQVPLQVLSTFDNQVGSELPGTLMKEGVADMEEQTVSGVAHTLHEGKITLAGLPNRPGVAAMVFGPLAHLGINVDMIVQASASHENLTDLTFTTPKVEIDRAAQILEAERAKIGFQELLIDRNIAKVSVVGLGMRSHPGVAAKIFAALAERQINVQAIETSEINIRMLIAEEYAELAVRTLHHTFGLDIDASPNL